MRVIAIARERACIEDCLPTFSQTNEANEFLAQSRFAEAVFGVDEYDAARAIAHIAPLGAERAHALVASHEVGSEKTANRGRTRTLGLRRLAETKERCRRCGAGEVLYLAHEYGVASRRVARPSGGA